MVDKIIRKQTLTLIVIVITLTTFIFTSLYLLFFEVDSYSYSNSKNDFDISFCNDKLCEDKYYNYNNLLGTIRVNNKVNLRKINNYESDMYAILEKPYIFSVKNNIKESNINIKFKLKKDYMKEEYIKYIDNIYIGIKENDSELKVVRFNDINDSILDNINIKSSEEKIFHVWVWSKNCTYKGNIYFPLKVVISS